jgi:hypothetical protein
MGLTRASSSLTVVITVLPMLGDYYHALRQAAWAPATASREPREMDPR